MVDLTERILNFQHCLQQLWNQVIWQQPSLRTDDTVSTFRRFLKPSLAEILIGDCSERTLGVLDPIDGKIKHFDDGVFVIPQTIPGAFSEVRIEDRHSRGIWRALHDTIGQDQASLQLYDFFDWTPYDYREFSLFLVKVVEWKTHPEHCGAFLLVKVNECRVVADDSIVVFDGPVDNVFGS